MNITRAVGRALALLGGLAIAFGAGAQTEAPAAARAKSARPASAAKRATQQPFALVVEPRAADLLKAMSAKLAAAKSMSFTAVVGYEYPSKLGPPIVYTTRYDVAMQRPDRLRVVSPGDGPASEFYYDGKTVMAYDPANNLVAVADAPPTIGPMLRAAYENAEIFYPFTDLLLPDPYAAISAGTVLAFAIGPSGVVGGVKTDMVAWANDEVFIQAWIGAEDGLPRRMRAVYRDDPLRLRHEMELSNWQLDPALPSDTFVSHKAQMAGRMAFAAPSLPPKGVKPVALRPKGKAAATTAPAATK